MIDVVMRTNQQRQIFEAGSDLAEGVFERGVAVLGVHTGIDQRPSSVTINQPDIDYRGPHRERQEDLVDAGMNFDYFR